MLPPTLHCGLDLLWDAEPPPHAPCPLPQCWMERGTRPWRPVRLPPRCAGGRWASLLTPGFCPPPSSSTCRLPGATARPRRATRSFTTLTASPPAASTARPATWWRTATAAWCTCQVSPTCARVRPPPASAHRCGPTRKILLSLSSRRCPLLHPGAVQGVRGSGLR